MKTILLTVCCALIAAVHADDNRPSRRPARLVRASGGLVEKTYAGKSIRFAAIADAVRSDALAAAVRNVKLRSRIPAIVESAAIPSGTSPWQAAAELAAKPDTGAAVVVVNDAQLPMLTASPDGRWAVLNLAAIKGDPSKFAARFGKLTWNAVALSLGVGFTGDRLSAIAPFSTVAELDALAAEPGPPTHNALVDAARLRGMGMLVFATYRQACQEGWAAAPTNDVQKAIWKQVHKVPDKPLTIEFDGKK